MAHREDIRSYLESLNIEGSVIDWGAGSKPVSKYVKGDGIFITLDINSNTNPDKIHDITKSIEIFQADHAFCMEVLEHVKHPRAVIRNIYNNLKKGGMLHLSVPFLYPKHGDQDYWRFTDEGLIYLMKESGFKNMKVWDITDGYLMEAVK